MIDNSTRQYGRNGTHELFMNTIMKIENCFAFDSNDDKRYSYEDVEGVYVQDEAKAHVAAGGVSIL